VLLRLNDRDKFLEAFRAAHPPGALQEEPPNPLLQGLEEAFSDPAAQ